METHSRITLERGGNFGVVFKRDTHLRHPAHLVSLNRFFLKKTAHDYVETMCFYILRRWCVCVGVCAVPLPPCTFLSLFFLFCVSLLKLAPLDCQNLDPYAFLPGLYGLRQRQFIRFIPTKNSPRNRRKPTSYLAVFVLYVNDFMARDQVFSQGYILSAWWWINGRDDGDQLFWELAWCEYFPFGINHTVWNRAFTFCFYFAVLATENSLSEQL